MSTLGAARSDRVATVQPAALVVGGGMHVGHEAVRGEDFDELTAVRVVCSLQLNDDRIIKYRKMV